MKKKLNIWIFLGIIFIIFNLSAATELLSLLMSIRIRTFVSVVSYKMVLNLLRIFGFVISFFLTSRCIKNKKYILGFLLLYVFAFVFPYLINNERGIAWMRENNTIMLHSVYTLMVVFVDSCYAIMLYLGYDWFNKQKRTQELEKKNLQSELSMLKNQINPHFLFNTLNNIDSLIKKNPDCASQSIVELSDMMRYMIYETNVEKIPLKKELEYIDNYMALQKLQYFNDDLVEYTITGNPENIEVAPMLFIPFIENAFKHCTNKETKHAIRFSFLLDTEKICFEATNIADKTQSISKDKTSGIGLDTVKRRLEILYPKKYFLEIQEKNDLFCVSLMIKIND